VTERRFIYLASITIILFWGTGFTLIGYAVKFIDPIWLVAMRTCMAAVVLSIYMHLRGHKFPRLRDRRWLWYGFMGLIGMVLPFFLTATGQIHVDSGLSAILIGFMPLITIVLAHFFVQGEQLSLRKSIGFFIGFLGIVLLFLPENLSLDLITHWRSQALILVAAVCYAVLTICAKRAPETPASVGASMMLICAASLSLILAMASGLPTTMPPSSAIFAVIALALGPTGFISILYLRLVQVAGPSLIATINNIVPACSLIAGMIFLNEPFSWRAFMAMFIIAVGLLIARRRKRI